MVLAKKRGARPCFDLAASIKGLPISAIDQAGRKAK
jgi:hypothetical protein